MNVTVTAEQHAVFVATGEVWVPVPMVGDPATFSSTGGTLVPDPAWLALTEPCETCGGTGIVRYVLCDSAWHGMSGNRPCPSCGAIGEPAMKPYDVPRSGRDGTCGSLMRGGCDFHIAHAGPCSQNTDSGPCPDCVNGRKRIELRVKCPRPDGRHADPIDICDDGLLLVATASVAEVLPVYDLAGSRKAVLRNEFHAWFDGQFGLLTWRDDEWESFDGSYLGDPSALVGGWLAHLVDVEAS